MIKNNHIMDSHEIFSNSDNHTHEQTVIAYLVRDQDMGLLNSVDTHNKALDKLFSCPKEGFIKHEIKKKLDSLDLENSDLKISELYIQAHNKYDDYMAPFNARRLVIQEHVGDSQNFYNALTLEELNYLGF